MVEANKLSEVNTRYCLFSVASGLASRPPDQELAHPCAREELLVRQPRYQRHHRHLPDAIRRHGRVDFGALQREIDYSSTTVVRTRSLSPRPRTLSTRCSTGRSVRSSCARHRDGPRPHPDDGRDIASRAAARDRASGTREGGRSRRGAAAPADPALGWRSHSRRGV